MRAIYHRLPWRRLALLAVGATFILGGCDPTLQTTVENGLITVSQSLLGSILQALIAVFQEANTTTARALSDLAPIFT